MYSLGYSLARGIFNGFKMEWIYMLRNERPNMVDESPYIRLIFSALRMFLLKWASARSWLLFLGPSLSRNMTTTERMASCMAYDFPRLSRCQSFWQCAGSSV